MQKRNNMTAVQELKYLFDDILKDRGIVITWDTYIEQEKQQILDAFEEGSSDGYDGWGSTNKEKYYNETYKQ